jgi:hypothetical protein
VPEVGGNLLLDLRFRPKVSRQQSSEKTMKKPHEEGLVERLADRLKDAVGLPPGKYRDGEAKPSKDHHEPRGTLTSEDAEGLPPHKGTGISPES